MSRGARLAGILAWALAGAAQAQAPAPTGAIPTPAPVRETAPTVAPAPAKEAQLAPVPAGAPTPTPAPVAYEPPAAVDYGTAPPTPRGFREHDGLFLRASFGVGAAIVSYREAVDGQNVSDVTTRGLASLIGISAGGRLVGNLMLHADLVLTGYSASDREVDGTVDARDRISGGLALLGGGVTYYLMPSNVFFTGILGVAGFGETRDGEDSVRSGLGLGLNMLIGKEWWVGRSGAWAVGGALRGSYYSIPLDIAYTESQLGAFDIGLVFDTTFN